MKSRSTGSLGYESQIRQENLTFKHRVKGTWNSKMKVRAFYTFLDPCIKEIQRVHTTALSFNNNSLKRAPVVKLWTSHAWSRDLRIDN